MSTFFVSLSQYSLIHIFEHIYETLEKDDADDDVDKSHFYFIWRRNYIIIFVINEQA